MPISLNDITVLFAGGTAIALRYGEYRESVDIVLFGLRLIVIPVPAHLVRDRVFKP